MSPSPAVTTSVPLLQWLLCSGCRGHARSQLPSAGPSLLQPLVTADTHRRSDRVACCCCCCCCRQAVPAGRIASVRLDLADLDSVRTCAQQWLDSGRPLDVLVNNAGVMACPLMRTKEGFEMQLGVNHLGHFLFTNMLLPSMQGGSG